MNSYDYYPIDWPQIHLSMIRIINASQLLIFVTHHPEHFNEFLVFIRRPQNTPHNGNSCWYALLAIKSICSRLMIYEWLTKDWPLVAITQSILFITYRDIYKNVNVVNNTESSRGKARVVSAISVLTWK